MYTILQLSQGHNHSTSAVVLEVIKREKIPIQRMPVVTLIVFKKSYYNYISGYDEKVDDLYTEKSLV